MNSIWFFIHSFGGYDYAINVLFSTSTNRHHNGRWLHYQPLQWQSLLKPIRMMLRPFWCVCIFTLMIHLLSFAIRWTWCEQSCNVAFHDQMQPTSHHPCPYILIVHRSLVSTIDSTQGVIIIHPYKDHIICHEHDRHGWLLFDLPANVIRMWPSDRPRGHASIRSLSYVTEAGIGCLFYKGEGD